RNWPNLEKVGIETRVFPTKIAHSRARAEFPRVRLSLPDFVKWVHSRHFFGCFGFPSLSGVPDNARIVHTEMKFVFS
ncbi:MAG: hypothetical protein ACK58L_17085, partial [Planctomycetota bacterium]